jgi:hypothetical protein
VPVAFVAVLAFPHPKRKRLWREHRAVCLPDFQGVGIGNAVSDAVGSVVRGFGGSYLSVTSHPAMIAARNRSPSWAMKRAPSLSSKTMPRGGIDQDSGRSGGLSTRMSACFEYVGPAMDRDQALNLWEAR